MKEGGRYVGVMEIHSNNSLNTFQNVDRVTFGVSLFPCPPGYVIAEDNTHPHLNICQCDLQNSDGIVNCDRLDIRIKVSAAYVGLLLV